VSAKHYSSLRFLSLRMLYGFELWVIMNDELAVIWKKVILQLVVLKESVINVCKASCINRNHVSPC
jgi:hypothetical protein